MFSVCMYQSDSHLLQLLQTAIYYFFGCPNSIIFYFNSLNTLFGIFKTTSTVDYLLILLSLSITDDIAVDLMQLPKQYLPLTFQSKYRRLHHTHSLMVTYKPGKVDIQGPYRSMFSTAQFINLFF